MENKNPNNGRWCEGQMEDNVLAMIDASGAKDTQDAHDDRIEFLGTIRAASIGSENGTPPTNKMYEAILRILRVGKSLELIMSSYDLLIELDKRYPRVYLSKDNKPKSACGGLIVVKEAWFPFVISSDSVVTRSEAGDKDVGGPLDFSSFYLLIQDLAELADKTILHTLGLKALRKMLLFQYLVSIIETDFVPRNATVHWIHLRESLLNMFLGSRRINYKGFMKNCLEVICILSRLPLGYRNYMTDPDNLGSGLSKNCCAAVTVALFEVAHNTCLSMKKLLMMIMELDISKKKAVNEGNTTRADGMRTPAVEIILDELIYNKDIISSFLQAFDEPEWKMGIILQYLWKYIPKPSVRTRRFNCSNDEVVTYNGALKCFSNNTSAKSIIKKIGTEVVQLLLAHGFQAQLSLLFKEEEAVVGDRGPEIRGRSALIDLSKNFISAFTNMRSAREDMEILSIGKEALFTATTIISMKS